MRNGSVLATLAALAALVACQQQEHPAPPSSPSTGGTQAGGASAKADEPLLLLDDEEEVKKLVGADNSRCHVCHLNYAAEPLAVNHARVNIGCAKCHGPSDAHIDDESWAEGGNGTAPDIMYPRDKINPACLACHPKEKLLPKTHRDFLAGKTVQKVCTDCHGEEHRLLKRKLKWK